MEKQRFYYDKKFLGGKAGRPIKFIGVSIPLDSFQKNNVDSTVVFWFSKNKG